MFRPYQKKFNSDIYEAWKKHRAVLGVMPTGGGKTYCFSQINYEHRGPSITVAHRKEIVSQISCALAKLEVKHRIVAPPSTVATIRRKHLKTLGKSFIDQNAPKGVASVQTLLSKSFKDQAWVKSLSLCILDEAHHYVSSGKWKKVLEMTQGCKLLGVTATPERADGLGLGSHADGFADVMIEGPSVKWLIENNYLAPYRYFCPKSSLSVEGIPITASGDLNTRKMAQRVKDSELTGEVVQHYLKFAAGTKAIVFATDVSAAETITLKFKKNGVAAECVSGQTDPLIRDKAIENFERGEVDVLVNVDLFDEGFDVPAVETAILARPTMSLAKYLQMIGRALRFVEGKTAIIIDAVRNVERHWLPDAPRKWSLDSVDRASKSPDGLVPQKVCDSCTQPYEAFYKECPYCGHVNKKLTVARAPLDQVEGDLEELDVACLSEIMEKIKHGRMSDSDYQADQIKRNLPAIARSADLKRFQTLRYRREVLDNLIKWWYGMQPSGRSLSEKHRRFYWRFGVDSATALTLNVNKTDDLINSITRKYLHDF